MITKNLIFFSFRNHLGFLFVLFQALLQLKDLRIGQWEEPYIGLTQENLIESSVQDSLPYIP